MLNHMVEEDIKKKKRQDFNNFILSQREVKKEDRDAFAASEFFARQMLNTIRSARLLHKMHMLQMTELSGEEQTRKYQKSLDQAQERFEDTMKTTALYQKHVKETIARKGVSTFVDLHKVSRLGQMRDYNEGLILEAWDLKTEELFKKTMFKRFDSVAKHMMKKHRKDKMKLLMVQLKPEDFLDSNESAEHSSQNANDEGDSINTQQAIAIRAGQKLFKKNESLKKFTETQKKMIKLIFTPLPEQEYIMARPQRNNASHRISEKESQQQSSRLCIEFGSGSGSHKDLKLGQQ